MYLCMSSYVPFHCNMTTFFGELEFEKGEADVLVVAAENDRDDYCYCCCYADVKDEYCDFVIVADAIVAVS